MDFLSPVLAFLMTLLVSAIQVICYPINQLVITALPDLSTKLTQTHDNLANALSAFPYLLSFLPPGVLALILFMLGVEVVMMYVFQSSFYVSKLWKIIQQIKFW